MSDSGFVFRGPLNVGVARGGHVDFTCSEIFPEFQIEGFPSGSSFIAKVSQTSRGMVGPVRQLCFYLDRGLS